VSVGYFRPDLRRGGSCSPDGHHQTEDVQNLSDAATAKLGRVSVRINFVGIGAAGPGPSCEIPVEEPPRPSIGTSKNAMRVLPAPRTRKAPSPGVWSGVVDGFAARTPTAHAPAADMINQLGNIREITFEQTLHIVVLGERARRRR
jgi:hypothetical protein